MVSACHLPRNKSFVSERFGQRGYREARQLVVQLMYGTSRLRAYMLYQATCHAHLSCQCFDICVISAEGTHNMSMFASRRTRRVYGCYHTLLTWHDGLQYDMRTTTVKHTNENDSVDQTARRHEKLKVFSVVLTHLVGNAYLRSGAIYAGLSAQPTPPTPATAKDYISHKSLSYKKQCDRVFLLRAFHTLVSPLSLRFID